jgi:hypothetical protein
LIKGSNYKRNAGFCRTFSQAYLHNLSIKLVSFLAARACHTTIGSATPKARYNSQSQQNNPKSQQSYSIRYFSHCAKIDVEAVAEMTIADKKSR